MNWRKQFLEWAFPLKKIDVKKHVAQKLLEKNRPHYLYKYRNCDTNGISVLETSSIWMARPDTLNDPYDCWYSYGGKEIVEIYESILRNRYPSTPQDVVNKWRIGATQRLIDENNKLRKIFKNTVKLCSLSESYNIDRMWKEYAKDHTGFCIEFDINNSDKNVLIDLFPVFYTDIRVDFNEYINLLFRDKSQVNGGFIRNALLIKEQKWLHEREWRIVRPDDGPQLGIPLSGLRINAILLGKNISKKDEERIVTICHRKNITIKCL